MGWLTTFLIITLFLLSTITSVDADCTKCARYGYCDSTTSTCKCRPGFIGDGQDCRMKCGTKICSSDAACIIDSIFGKLIRSCQCVEGFSGDGEICTHIDECISNPCKDNSICHNTKGGYRCECMTGFTNDGPYKCKVLPTTTTTTASTTTTALANTNTIPKIITTTSETPTINAETTTNTAEITTTAPDTATATPETTTATLETTTALLETANTTTKALTSTSTTNRPTTHTPRVLTIYKYSIPATAINLTDSRVADAYREGMVATLKRYFETAKNSTHTTKEVTCTSSSATNYECHVISTKKQTSRRRRMASASSNQPAGLADFINNNLFNNTKEEAEKANATVTATGNTLNPSQIKSTVISPSAPSSTSSSSTTTSTTPTTTTYSIPANTTSTTTPTTPTTTTYSIPTNTTSTTTPTTPSTTTTTTTTPTATTTTIKTTSHKPILRRPKFLTIYKYGIPVTAINITDQKVQDVYRRGMVDTLESFFLETKDEAHGIEGVSCTSGNETRYECRVISTEMQTSRRRRMASPVTLSLVPHINNDLVNYTKKIADKTNISITLTRKTLKEEDVQQSTESFVLQQDKYSIAVPPPVADTTNFTDDGWLILRAAVIKSLEEAFEKIPGNVTVVFCRSLDKEAYECDLDSIELTAEDSEVKDIIAETLISGLQKYIDSTIANGVKGFLGRVDGLQRNGMVAVSYSGPDIKLDLGKLRDIAAELAVKRFLGSSTSTASSPTTVTSKCAWGLTGKECDQLDNSPGVIGVLSGAAVIVVLIAVIIAVSCYRNRSKDNEKSDEKAYNRSYQLTPIDKSES